MLAVVYQAAIICDTTLDSGLRMPLKQLSICSKLILCQITVLICFSVNKLLTEFMYVGVEYKDTPSESAMKWSVIQLSIFFHCVIISVPYPETLSIDTINME